MECSSSMRWQVPASNVSRCSPCKKESVNSYKLHYQHVLSCVDALQIPFTMNGHGKAPSERRRHRVLAVCREEHVLQVLHCCCKLFRETELRYYKQLDASLPCIW